MTTVDICYIMMLYLIDMGHSGLRIRISGRLLQLLCLFVVDDGFLISADGCHSIRHAGKG